MSTASSTESEAFRRAFEDAPIGMALVKVDEPDLGRFLRVNRALCAVTGYTEAQLLAGHFQSISHPDDVQSDLEHLADLVAGGVSSYQIEKRYRHAEHHSVWVLVTASLVRDDDDEPLYSIRQIQDINARKNVEGQLEYLADNDPLTGLYNRRRFARELTHQLDFARRYGGSGTLVAVDLDHLKQVNDTYGHSAGDELISACARILVQRSRSSDVVGRLGGDEFAVTLPHTDKAAAAAWCEGFIEALRADHGLALSPLPEIGASVGIVAFDEVADASASDLQVCADLAMYEAKRAGGNQVAHYGPELELEASNGAMGTTWSARIRSALRDDRFVLYGQPIVDVNTGAVEQLELLLRLPLASGEVILPGAFIYSAERFGLVRDLDRWVLGRALEHAAAAPGKAVAINISAESVTDPELGDMVEAGIARTGARPADLVFEITETAAITNMAAAQRSLSRLIRLGARVSLDDFGAGFGSFHHLKQLPLQFVKIDGEFIRNLAASRTDRIFVQTMIELAHRLGQRAIAEHVESQATLDVVRELGADLAQGNFIGTAQPLVRPQ